MEVLGFVVRRTESAIAFVAAGDAKKAQVGPAWVPLKKVLDSVELDDLSVKIDTKNDGVRIGIPTRLTVDPAFADKIGLTA